MCLSLKQTNGCIVFSSLELLVSPNAQLIGYLIDKTLQDLYCAYWHRSYIGGFVPPIQVLHLLWGVIVCTLVSPVDLLWLSESIGVRVGNTGQRAA